MIELRQATASDAPVLAALHSRTVREVCGRDYSSAQIDVWLARQTVHGMAEAIKDGTVVVAVDDVGAIVGFGDRSGNTIRALYVSAGHQGQGVGRALLERLEADASAEGQEALTAHSSITAVGFYRRMGYEIGERVDCPVTREVPLAAFAVRKRLA